MRKQRETRENIEENLGRAGGYLREHEINREDKGEDMKDNERYLKTFESLIVSNIQVMTSAFENMPP